MLQHGHIETIFSQQAFIFCLSSSDRLFPNPCIIGPNIFSILNLLLIFLFL